MLLMYIMMWKATSFQAIKLLYPFGQHVDSVNMRFFYLLILHYTF